MWCEFTVLVSLCVVARWCGSVLYSCTLLKVQATVLICLYSWLFPVMIVNKNSLNYCSSSDKSKRRTKTVKKSLEPKWNQTFMYSPVHRREFRERMLEITLWDQARVREEESEFLGEVRKPDTSRTHKLLIPDTPTAWNDVIFCKSPSVTMKYQLRVELRDALNKWFIIYILVYFTLF